MMTGLTDSRACTLIISVGKLFHNLISDGKIANLKHIYCSMAQDNCGYVLFFEMRRQVEESGCWYLNKKVNDSVHQDDLSMLSASVKIIPAKLLDALLVRLYTERNN